MGRLLFLGASVSQQPAIRFAKAAGHTVVACDSDPDAVAFQHCDVASVVDFSDVDRVAEVGARERVDGVLAVCTDRAVVPAALVAERLGLPGIAPDVARAMTHKPTMRARLASDGVPQPISRTLRADDDLATLRSVPLPAVLKPADSGGQRGLFRIERFEQVEAHLPAALAASRTGEAIFEQYVEGVEVNTLFVVRDGVPKLVILSDRLRPSGAGFGVGWIHSYPSALPAATQAEIEEVGTAAINSLGMRDGIAFPQLIAGERGVVVVEVAARIAAGQMADLVRHATGVELYRIAIQQALGLPVPDSWVAGSSRPVAIRFLTAAPGVLPVGTVRAVTGLDEVRSSPGVLDAGLYFGAGTVIGPLQVDADRRGYVIATAPTAREALARADAAARKLRVDVGDARPRRRWRRRAGASLIVVALVVSTAVALSLMQTAKVQHALIGATRVDKTFSPVCGCGRDVAHIAFRVIRRELLGAQIVDRAGATVATLLAPRLVGPGRLALTWTGRTASGALAPDGVYYPDVRFPRLSRSLRLPSPITVDTDRPRIEHASLAQRSGGVTLRYRFSEPARASLVVGGRRAVLTRFEPRSGVLRWSGRLPSGARARRGEALSLVAIDSAGNVSRPERIGHVS